VVNTVNPPYSPYGNLVVPGDDHIIVRKYSFNIQYLTIYTEEYLEIYIHQNKKGMGF